MSTSTKAFLCSMLLMLVVMALLFMMSVFKFQSTLTDLVQSRLTVVGESVADALEGAIDLGLILSELSNAEELISRARASDPSIETIDIFDPHGRVIFSTTTGRTGTQVSARALEAQARATARSWGLESGTLFASGVNITNSIGQITGGVLFTYSKAEFEAKVSHLTHRLLRNMALIFVLLSMFAWVGIRLGFRSLDHYMQRVERAVASFPDPVSEMGTEVTAAANETALPNPEVLEHKLRLAAHQMDEARRALAALESRT